MTEFVVDTNVAIEVLNHPATSAQRLDPDSRLVVPVTVLGELFFGAENSSRRSSNVARVEALVQDVRVLPCDLDTARHYARVRFGLRTAGAPIPEADYWIAAAAIQHQLPLLTRDKHFRSIPGLTVIAW